MELKKRIKTIKKYIHTSIWNIHNLSWKKMNNEINQKLNKFERNKLVTNTNKYINKQPFYKIHHFSSTGIFLPEIAIS